MESTETTQVEQSTEVIRKQGLEGTIEANRTLITRILVGVIVLLGGFYAYKAYYLAPMEEEAMSKIFMAQRYFEQDSFNYALNGDKTNPGFITIADEYGQTKAGNLAHYYLGVIYLNKGKYQDAIDNLKSFSSNSHILQPLALGATGDAYSQLKDYSAAADYYVKAATFDDNAGTSPRYLKKAGIVFEELKEYDKAIQQYQLIKDKYPRTEEAMSVDAYIGRAMAASQQ